MPRGFWLFRVIMKSLEKLYIWVESKMEYPDDHTILGVPVDPDLQDMTRRELCDYIEESTPGEGSFWALDSTTKIRFGCQMMRAGLTLPLEEEEPFVTTTAVRHLTPTQKAHQE